MRSSRNYKYFYDNIQWRDGAPIGAEVQVWEYRNIFVIIFVHMHILLSEAYKFYNNLFQFYRKFILSNFIVTSRPKNDVV